MIMMARIKLSIPDKIISTVTIPVRITDINYGNHLGNDALVSLVHEARMQWLKQHQYSELNIEGTSLIMSDLAVEYIREAFYGDILEINIAAGEISRVGFEIYYLLETNRNGEQITIAKAKTGMVCYDYAAKKVVAVPDRLKEILV